MYLDGEYHIYIPWIDFPKFSINTYFSLYPLFFFYIWLILSVPHNFLRLYLLHTHTPGYPPQSFNSEWLPL